MNKKIFEKEDSVNRAQLLNDNADEIILMSYTKHFNSEELSTQREQLSEKMIALNQLNDELLNIKAKFKLLMKPLDNEIAELLSNIKFKGKTVSENCFKLIDHESNQVGFYNIDGDLVSERSLMIEERQFKLQIKTGTNQ
jgi:hypothetical protein